jgi:serine/threonine-protein phosphatase 2A catalytic subunit
MDTNMEDVPRAPADVSPVQTEPASIPTLDGWIESLMACKQLAEGDVQRLCDKVSSVFIGRVNICGLDATSGLAVVVSTL